MENQDEPTNDFLEKPLSPVLTSGKIPRRLLMSRKIQKKSRVKLLDRFSEEASKNVGISKGQDQPFLISDETLTPSATMLGSVQVFENIESEEKFVQCGKGNVKDVKDFEFKKPVSPARTYSTIDKSGQSSKTASCDEGFKTAAGKNIYFSNDVLVKSKNLFDDILTNCSQSSRSNKYAFLSKTKHSVENHDYSNHLSENSDQFKTPNILNSNSPCNFGFKVASGKNVKISETAFEQAQNRCGEDFNDCKSFLRSSEISKKTHVSENYLDTQETDELFSEITFHENQLCKNVDIKKVTPDGDFKGFTEDSIEESWKNMENCIQRVRDTEQLYEVSNNNKQKIFQGGLTIVDKDEKICYFNTTLDDFTQNIKESNKKNLTTNSPFINVTNNKFECGSSAVDTTNSHSVLEEITILSSQETAQLVCDFSSMEDIIEEEEQFRGFTEDSMEESEKKADNLKLFLMFYDDEKTLCPTSNSLPSQEISNISVEKNVLSNAAQSCVEKSTEMKENINIFKDIETCTLVKPCLNIGGFTTASGKAPTISKAALDRAQNIFKESVEQKQNEIFPEAKSAKIEPFSNIGGFTFASGKQHTISKATLSKAQNLFKDLDEPKSVFQDNNTSNPPFEGFTSASGNKHLLSEVALDRAQNMFKQLTELEGNNSLQECKTSSVGNSCLEDFASTSGKINLLSRAALDSAQNVFKEFADVKENLVNISTSDKLLLQGFASASGKKHSISKTALGRAQNIYRESGNIEHYHNTASNFQTNQSGGFQTANGNSYSLSKDALNRADKLFQNLDNNSLDNTSENSKTTIQDVSMDEVPSFDKSKTSNTSLSSSRPNSTKKKRLGSGVSACKMITVSTDTTNRIKHIFENEKSSPLRHKSHASVYNSTPLKQDLNGWESNITPIKKEKFQNVKLQESEAVDDSIVIQDCTKGNIDSWCELFENAIKKFEQKVKTFRERQEVLKSQKRFLNRDDDNRKREAGVLFSKKKSVKQIKLKDFCEIDGRTESKYPSITPQIAELVHFNFKDCDITYLKTLDGACVVPNTQNIVGLSEIETAFKGIPGVEPKLIPKDWIKNHFKWIVWKLASYQTFASNLEGSLCVENVIQQLKYRYDREIDRAERPTLRKIFELDDSPQKLMTLCVSNIFDLRNNKFELELTDGWYAIRTVIDEPLCRQISKGKIKIGTKLMLLGAELLNCDGCHPLEATDMVRLKINCNSTRRAMWHTKLGFQKHPVHPVTLNSCFPNGGVIGCIKVYIARVYPVKYLEKQNNLSVWRNRRAEEIRAQEWENRSREDMENIRETVRQDYEKSFQKSGPKNFKLSEAEIKNMTCPETLYNWYHNSKDPESLQEILSFSQQKSIMQYQQQIIFRQQQEISRKIEDSIKNLKTQKRDVTSVLQLLVVDSIDLKEATSVFQIWRPSEEHLDIIKESTEVFVYNVLPKKNGGFTTTNQSKFELVSQISQKFDKYKRILFPICEVCNAVNKPTFNEFDTVGIVIQTSVTSFSQNLWLADTSGSLLFINIFDGPNNCLLLDKLKNGQVVAVSNLIFCESNQEFGEAIANHLTVISSYPQHRHLQEGINRLNAGFPKDLNGFLKDCNQKILYYTDKGAIAKGFRNVSSKSLVQSSSLDSSNIFDDDDTFYSMIDIDKIT